MKVVLFNNIKHFFKRWPKRPLHHTWWQIVIFWLGIIVILLNLTNLFLTPNNSPEDIYASDQIPEVGSVDFLSSLEHLTHSPIDNGGTISVLENGNDYLEAQLAAIQAAEKTINFTTFIWQEGEMSTKMINALLERQRNGVEVRILLDSIGSAKAPLDRFAELTEAGGRVEFFRSIQPNNLARVHRRNHRRSIVIDGRVGFTGGSAVFDPFLGNGEDDGHWRELMFEVTGIMAKRLQAGFIDLWAGSTGEILIGEKFYPTELTDTDTGLISMQVISSPTHDIQSLWKFILLSIQSAKQSVHITTPYFIPDKHLLKALTDKASEGVTVNLVLPGEYTDQGLVKIAMRSYYNELMDAGVNIYEYRRSFNHAKYIIIDGQWVVVGSANLNSRSRSLDQENLLAIYDQAFSERMEEIFGYDISYSEKINPEEWRRAHAKWQPFYFLSKVGREHY